MTTESYNIYDILAEVRDKPAMHLGLKSISHLKLFLDGYSHAMDKLGYKEVSQPRFGHQESHQWFEQKLSLSVATRNWDWMTLAVCNGDEAKAFDRFYELLDEYRCEFALRETSP